MNCDELLNIDILRSNQSVRHIVDLCCRATDFEPRPLNADWNYPSCSFTGANTTEDNRLLQFRPIEQFPLTFVVHKDVVPLLYAIRVARSGQRHDDAAKFIQRATAYFHRRM